MRPPKQVILGANPVEADAYMHGRLWKSSGVSGVHVVSAAKRCEPPSYTVRNFDSNNLGLNPTT